MTTVKKSTGEAVPYRGGDNAQAAFDRAVEAQLAGYGLKVVSMRADPQASAFDVYRLAFRANEASPNLKNARALVAAWNAFAAVMGLEPA